MYAKVSVIIPVFNTSAYITRCCHSLFSQTLSDIQFIFVDDGSNDGSFGIVRQVLMQYPERFGQCLLLSQSHQGVSAARQYGLDHATGEYVIHCDSDDWVEPMAYEQLYKHSISTNADVVTFGYQVEDEEGNKLQTVNALQLNHGLTFSISPKVGSLWLKMVRRQLLHQNKLRLPVGINWGEDLCLSLQILILSRNTQTLDLPFYHYVQYHSSITHTIDTQRCNELVKCGDYVERWLKDNNSFEQYREQLLWLKFQLKQYFLIFPQVRDLKRWRMLFPECHSRLMYYHSPLYLRLSGWLVLHGLQPIAYLLLSIRDLYNKYKFL